jgi:two-component system, chemotaxis family, CheB/CheR fusion protein
MPKTRKSKPELPEGAAGTSKQVGPKGSGHGQSERTVSSHASRRSRAANSRIETSPDDKLVVVGIGASAGGLEALIELLDHLPDRTGMAFVVVQHLDPRHESLLSELLGKHTKLPVREATEGTKVQPDHVYIIPPNKNMTLEKGALRLAARTLHRGQHMPVDIFLRSLAADRGSRAAGVILSGANTDGALGIEAIKAEGGITFVQDPGSARHRDMPTAALETGCVDFVLAPAGIGQELARIDKHSYVRTLPVVDTEGPAIPTHVKLEGEPVEEQTHVVADAEKGRAAQSLQRIYALLRSSVGVDFAQYKPATVQRRIQRRMALLRLERIEDYARFLRTNEAEIVALYQDILIKVTSFFRDPAVFDYLKRWIFPRILKSRTRDEGIRIWVPGCSSGEEAYSIAICLAEYLGRGRRSDFPVQIFATDLSEASLDRARDGVYIENIALDVSADRLRRFFVRNGHNFQIIKSVREMVIFAKQNLAKDPPFSHLDLISCRNVLIYLGAAVQKKLFPMFHYALRHGGYLLLGKSENIGEFTDLFAQGDKRSRIFLRKDHVPRGRLGPFATALLGGHAERADLRAVTAGPPPSRIRSEPSAAEAEKAELDIQREVNRILLQRYTPSGVVVNSELEVVQFHGKGQKYFAPAPGKASFSLLKLIKEGLAVQSRAAIAAARRDGRVVKRRASFSDDAGIHQIDLEVIPLRGSEEHDRHFLVLFNEFPPSVEAPADTKLKSDKPSGRGHQDDRKIEALMQELGATRQYLQSIIEEQDASNEEIKSANEEILSSNEELQSTNEELETAKEELQSSNEELVTVNEELQNRNIDLALANNDLTNLINSVNFAIVILSNNGHIRRFTPVAGRLFNLIPADVGRPFTDISSNLQIPNLSELIDQVIETMSPMESEVQERAGRWYKLSIRPYRTGDNKIEGAILALVDIDMLKRSLEDTRQSRDFAQAVVATVREPLIVLDSNFVVMSANTAFYHAFQTSRDEIAGQPFYGLGNGQWNIPSLRKRLEEVVEKGNRFENFVVDYQFRDLGRKRLLVSARRVEAEAEKVPSILLAIEDISERRQVEQEILAISEREQRRMGQDLHDGLGQQLTGIGFMIQAYLNDIEHESHGPLTEWLQKLLEQINQAAALTRELARGLHPIELQAGHFRTAMQALASNVENLFKVLCTFHCDEPCLVPGNSDETATHLYRITQEAINNALKHGKAKRIAITYTRDDQTKRTTLSISDDGSGIRHLPRTGVITKGMGLQIMRYRAEAIGGKLVVARGVNNGTVVSVSFGDDTNPE